MKRTFEKVGGITNATVWKDDDTGKSKGAGKVEFESTELALRALEALCTSGAPANVLFATVFTDADTDQIGIQYDKVIEWLSARGKVPEDWRTTLKTIQAKTSLAKKDILADKASSVNDLDYFKIKKFSPADSFQEVLDLYKQGNTHVAEAASSLKQIVRHDIPGAKDQAQSCQKQAQDVERRQRDLKAREVEVKRKFKEMCDVHQIAGDNVNTELQKYIATAVPKCLDDATAKITSSCKEPLSFYRSFSQLLLAGEKGATADDMPLLTALLQCSGNALLKDAASWDAKLKAEWQNVQEQWKDKDTKSDEIDVRTDPANLKVLANTLARGLVVDELVELEAFLAERCWELEESEKGQVEQNTAVKVEFNLEKTREFHSKVSDCIEALSGKEVQPLLLMQSSQHARHVASQLLNQKALCEKPGKETSALEQRRVELVAEADVLQKEVDRLQAEAQHLKGWLEEEISKLTKHKVRLLM